MAVILKHRGGDGAGGRKAHPAGDVVEQVIARSDGFRPPAVAALDSLHRETLLSRLAEIVGGDDQHPALPAARSFATAG